MLRRIDARLYLAFVSTLLGIAILGATCTGGSHAQRPDSRRELAVAVAKVAVNEASLQVLRPAEVALIYQCAETRATTVETRLSWLRAHSSCVLTSRPLTEREEGSNCRWTRHLEDSDAEPENWPEALEWEGAYQRRWGQIREFAYRLVLGHERMRPCDGRPFSWGGPMDHARALRLGLRPLNCRDPQSGERTLNEGYALVGGDES